MKRIVGWLVLIFGLLFAGKADAKPSPLPKPPGPKPKPGPDPPAPPFPVPVPEPPPEPVPEPSPQPLPDVDDYEPVPGAEPLWMLPGNSHGVRPWSFGQRRPFGSSNPTRHHSGIDIDAEALDPVLMPEDGIVIKKQGWSGALTRGLHVQLLSGPLLVVGALHPTADLADVDVNQVLRRGELLGRIGTYPGGSTMLHVEQWTVGAKRVPWLWDQARPAQLVDPTAYLKSMER